MGLFSGSRESFFKVKNGFCQSFLKALTWKLLAVLKCCNFQYGHKMIYMTLSYLQCYTKASNNAMKSVKNLIKIQ